MTVDVRDQLVCAEHAALVPERSEGTRGLKRNHGRAAAAVRKSRAPGVGGRAKKVSWGMPMERRQTL